MVLKNLYQILFHLYKKAKFTPTDKLINTTSFNYRNPSQFNLRWIFLCLEFLYIFKRLSLAPGLTERLSYLIFLLF